MRILSQMLVLTVTLTTLVMPPVHAQRVAPSGFMNRVPDSRYEVGLDTVPAAHRSRAAGALHGALIGAGIGAAVGVVAVTIDPSRGSGGELNREGQYIVAALLLGVVGSVFGAFVGAATSG